MFHYRTTCQRTFTGNKHSPTLQAISTNPRGPNWLEDVTSHVRSVASWLFGAWSFQINWMIINDVFVLHVSCRELTYPPDKAYLKMIFLFPSWDMLIPWRVSFAPTKKSRRNVTFTTFDDCHWISRWMVTYRSSPTLSWYVIVPWTFGVLCTRWSFDDMWSEKENDEKIRSPPKCIKIWHLRSIEYGVLTYIFWGIPQATTSNWLDPIEWTGVNGVAFSGEKALQKCQAKTLKSDAPKRAVGMSQKQTPQKNPNEIKVVVIFCNWKKLIRKYPLF